MTIDELKLAAKSAGDTISPENPDTQYQASLLLNLALRREVWGGDGTIAPSLKNFLHQGLSAHRYDQALALYSEAELDEAEQAIDHTRDLGYTYAAIVWWMEKYLVQDRASECHYETPQFAIMITALALYAVKPREVRMQLVRDLYHGVSTLVISQPTPVRAGLRTPLRQFASCTLAEMDDTLDSIGHTNLAMMKYGAARAGLGLNISRIRPQNSTVASGEVVSTGVIPFLKMFESTIKSTSQHGVRSASATVFFQFWHLEVESLVIAKSSTRGSHDRKVFKLDYCIVVNRMLYLRAIAGQDITLFNPNEVKDLYEAWGTPDFDRLYVECESRPGLTTKKISAKELVNLSLDVTLETGRLYYLHIENCNTHSSFSLPVRMSNLCLSGDTKLLTTSGYRPMRDLWLEQGCHELGSGADFNSSFVVNQHGVANSTPVVRTSESSEVFDLKLSGGLTVRATAHHEFELYDGGRARLFELAAGSRIRVSNTEFFGDFDDITYAELAGHLIGDGSVSTRNATSQHGIIKLWDDEIDELGPVFSSLLKQLFTDSSPTSELVPDYSFSNKHFDEAFGYWVASARSLPFGRRLLADGVTPGSKHRVPASIWRGTKTTVGAFLRGLYTADATIGCYGASASVTIAQVSKSLLREVQVLLSQFGIMSSLHPGVQGCKRLMKDGKGGMREYDGKATWRLMISSRDNLVLFADLIGVRQESKMASLREWLATHPGSNNSHNLYFREVESITYAGEEETFCLTEPENHQIIVNGIVTGQCMEVTHPTIPIQHIDGPGWIGLCILSALNATEITADNISRIAYTTVSHLDTLIDYQSYPVPAAEQFCKYWRSLGVGLTNLAAWLAREGLTYDHPDAPNRVAELMEMVQWHLLDASCKLAEELGAAPGFRDTKYAQGLLPIDHYKKDLDTIVTVPLKMDWEGLRERIKKHGLRNCTLSAQMPCESSSVVQNSTNGIDPVRSEVTFKKSKSGPVRVLVPQVLTREGTLGVYQHAFGMKDNFGYLSIAAAIQKFMCMSISTNLYYQYKRYPDGKIPLELILREQLFFFRIGGKSLYYIVSDDDDRQTVSEHVDTQAPFLEESGCAGGACTL